MFLKSEVHNLTKLFYCKRLKSEKVAGGEKKLYSDILAVKLFGLYVVKMTVVYALYSEAVEQVDNVVVDKRAENGRIVHKYKGFKFRVKLF